MISAWCMCVVSTGTRYACLHMKCADLRRIHFCSFLFPVWSRYAFAIVQDLWSCWFIFLCTLSIYISFNSCFSFYAGRINFYVYLRFTVYKSWNWWHAFFVCHSADTFFLSSFVIQCDCFDLVKIWNGWANLITVFHCILWVSFLSRIL